MNDFFVPSGGSRWPRHLSVQAMACGLAWAVCCVGFGWASVQAPSASPVEVTQVNELFVEEEACFHGRSEQMRRGVFTAVPADMDADGDCDLLINWHNTSPLELFENRGGAFHALDLKRSGLVESFACGTVFARESAMAVAIEARALGGHPDGIFVWHDIKRKGPWHASVRLSKPVPGLRLRLFCNRKLSLLNSNEDLRSCTILQRPRKSETELTWNHALTQADFQWTTEGASAQLALQVEFAGSERSEQLPALFIGPDFCLAPQSRFDLWTPDPHGLAWVDVLGDERLELFVGRGALGGNLRAKQPPKRNRFYLPLDRSSEGADSSAEGTRALYELSSLIPPDHGRARQVEWVQLDQDPEVELCLGNRTLPNALLELGSAGQDYADRAEALGLAHEAESFVWLDVDADGDEDLVFGAGSKLAVLVREGELNAPSFSFSKGGAFGLHVPKFIPRRQKGKGGYFDRLRLHSGDFNGDGRCDLVATGLGRDADVLFFYGNQDGFQRFAEPFLKTGHSEGSLETQQAPRPGAETSVLMDANNDGWLDVLCFNKRLFLLRNAQGAGFEYLPLDLGVDPATHLALAVADTNGDLFEDLIVVTDRPRLFLSQGSGKSNMVQVSLEPAAASIGTLVTAIHQSGRRQVLRWGSARNPAFSQCLNPLLFSSPAGDGIEAIEVAWLGSKSVTSETLDWASKSTLRLTCERPK